MGGGEWAIKKFHGNKGEKLKRTIGSKDYDGYDSYYNEVFSLKHQEMGRKRAEKKGKRGATVKKFIFQNIRSVSG